jgi:hypothetical protein
MKKLILNLILLCSFSPLLRAQSFEISVGANTGMFAYHGTGTTPTAEIITGSQSSENYVNNPYVNKYALSYGVSVQPQFVFKSGFIVGLQGSYNILRSTAPVTSVYPYDIDYLPNYYNVETGNQPATGNVTMRAQEINVNPYIGYRLQAGSIKLDIMPGLGFGFDLNNREKGSGTIESSHTNYPVDYETEKSLTDLQLKLGIGAEWHKWGLVASYTRGTRNIVPTQYYEQTPNSNGNTFSNTDKVHTSLFTLGISYRLFSVNAK